MDLNADIKKEVPNLNEFENVINYKEKLKNKVEILPSCFDEVLNNSFKAKALLLALLFNSDEIIKEKQLELINDENLRNEAFSFIKVLEENSEFYFLIIYEKMMDAFKTISIDEYRKFRNLLNKLIYVDNNLDIFEWSIENLVIRELDKFFELRRTLEQKYHDHDELTYSIEVFLSLIIDSQKLDYINALITFKVASESNNLFELNFINKDDISTKILRAAIKEIQLSSFDVRKRVFNAAILIVCRDNHIEKSEIELLHSLALLLDVDTVFRFE